MAKRAKGRVKVGVSSGAKGIAGARGNSLGKGAKRKSASQKGATREKPRKAEEARGAKALERRLIEDEGRWLEPLENLAHVPSYGDLSPSESQVAAFRAYARACGGEQGLSLGFVCRLDRHFPAICSAAGLVRAEYAERIFKGDLSRVAVGDWVVLRKTPVHDVGYLIEEVLPRTRVLTRWRGSKRGSFQVLAANMDLVLVAQPLGRRELSLDRIVRSAVVAADCGCSVVVILTKADRVSSTDRLKDDVKRVRDTLGENVKIVVLAAGALAQAHRADDDCARWTREATQEGKSTEDVAQNWLYRLEETALFARALWGVEALRSLVVQGSSAVLLGESGTGKSTLLNALLGDEVLATGSVRKNDDAGRHTTVARRMVKLPNAGVVIDAPGLRSLPLVGHERGLARVFPEICDYAASCRFADCAHGGEPGCAVRAAVEKGEISAARVEAYRLLSAEMRSHASGLDPDIHLFG